MKKIIVISAVLAALAQSALAGNPGDKAALFLTLPQGGRPTAMGEAFTAIGGDIYSGHWNPAGLAELGPLALTASLAPTYLDMAYGYLAAAVSRRRNAFGLAVSYFDYGDLQGLDANGLNPTTFTANDICLGLTYARRFAGKKLSVGGSVKYLRESIEQETASAAMIDAGAVKQLGRFTAGASLRNIGTGLKFNSEASGLPIVLSLGGTYYFMDTPLVPALAIDAPLDDNPILSLGAEYTVLRYLSLRAGLRTERDQGFASWLRGGMGVNYGGFGVDYAVIPAIDLGYTHMVTLGYRK